MSTCLIVAPGRLSQCEIAALGEHWPYICRCAGFIPKLIAIHVYLTKSPWQHPEDGAFPGTS